MKRRGIRDEHTEWRYRKLGFNLDDLNITKTLRQKVINNCVEPEIGLHILNESKRNIQPDLFK